MLKKEFIMKECISYPITHPKNVKFISFQALSTNYLTVLRFTNVRLSDLMSK